MNKIQYEYSTWQWLTRNMLFFSLLSMDKFSTHMHPFSVMINNHDFYYITRPLFSLCCYTMSPSDHRLDSWLFLANFVPTDGHLSETLAQDKW